MYPQPGQTGQWNPNPPPPATPGSAPPSSQAPPQQQAPPPQQTTPQPAPPPQQHTPQQQQTHSPAGQQPPPPTQQQQAQQQPVAPQWSQSPVPQQSPQAQQPQLNGQYPRPPSQIAPMAPGQHPPPPHMAPLQAHPDYRALPPMYSHSPYHPQPQMPYPPHQPAPRQRTAIACRYCRRRKIRCSGFDQSEDGRCTNCQRFQQDCVFTPVNQQSQAFVPAHTVLNRQGGAMPTQFYGAFGQPIAPPYYPQYPPNGYPQQPYPPHMQPPMPGQPMPGAPMNGQPMHPGQQPPMDPNQAMHMHQHYQPYPPPMDPQMAPQLAGQKRPNEEPHAATPAPPNPALTAQAAQAEQLPQGVESGVAALEDTAAHATFDPSLVAQEETPALPQNPAQGSPQEQQTTQPELDLPQEDTPLIPAVIKREAEDKTANGTTNGYPAPESEADAPPPAVEPSD